MKTQHIKKTALLVGAAVLLSGAATLSVRHYQDYKVQQDAVVAQEQAREAAKDKRLTVAEARVVDLVGKYENQRLNCEKGLASYGLLSTVVKARIAVPTCGPVITK